MDEVWGLMTWVWILGMAVVAFYALCRARERMRFEHLASQFGLTRAPGEDFDNFAERVKSTLAREFT